VLGRVLVVENNLPYAEEACDRLREQGCEAVLVPDSETFEHARANGDEYDEIVLAAVRQAFEEKGAFDVLVCNLHLKDEPDGLWAEGDWLGVEVLNYAATKYPGLVCILCTAQPPSLYTDFTERYPLANVVFKIPPIPEPLCRAVVKVLTEGYPVKRKIGRSYELRGINSQIYRFLHNHGIMASAFRGVKEYDMRLIRVLGGGMDEPVGEAVDLVADLWNADWGLPAYPLASQLAEMEYRRIFWEGHRDHLLHQLLVYLLGLYLYYGSDHLRDALSAIMTEQEFLCAWKVAALFHDLGYVFEIDREKTEEIYDKVFEELNDLRKRCLHHFFSARNVEFLPAQDDAIRERGQIYVSEVESREILRLTQLGNEDLFALLEPQAKKAHLGLTEQNLRHYWEHARSNWTKDQQRKPFADHGITGALILLQQYLSLRNYLAQALPVLNREHLVHKEMFESIREVQKSVQNCHPAIMAAASAIALHNINVEAWDRNHAYTSRLLTLHEFRLSLKETPFEFFMALVDALQCWDRPKYVISKRPHFETQAQDMMIRFIDGKIVLACTTDSPQVKSSIDHTLKQLPHYMRAEEIELLLGKLA